MKKKEKEVEKEEQSRGKIFNFFQGSEIENEKSEHALSGAKIESLQDGDNSDDDDNNDDGNKSNSKRKNSGKSVRAGERYVIENPGEEMMIFFYFKYVYLSFFL